jgi:DNA-binding MarR family transcriptional regulator
MTESGKEYPSKSHQVYDRIIDRVDTVENNTQQSPQFTDKELAILEIWKTQPNISIRKLAEQTDIPKSTVGRIVAGLKCRL